jgi:hypothetical protein
MNGKLVLQTDNSVVLQQFRTSVPPVPDIIQVRQAAYPTFDSMFLFFFVPCLTFERFPRALFELNPDI